MRKTPRGPVALGVLTGVNLLNYVDRYVPAGAMPLILATFAVSDAKGGLLQSMFMFPYAIVSPLAGALGDRRSRFAIAGLGVLVWSLATFGSGLAPVFGALLLARVLIGVGEASYTVVTPSLLGDYYPAERRGRVMAIFYAAIPVGSAAGFMVGGAVGAALGWRWAFFLAGLPGFLLALALLAFRDPPRGGQDPASRSVPITSASSPTVSAASAASAPRWRELFARRSYTANVVAQTIYTFSMGGLAAWMPTYFYRVRHLPLARASILFGGVVCVAGLTGTLLGGALGDARARRDASAHFGVAGIGLIASFPFTLLAILSPTPAIFWPAMFVTLLLIFLNTGPLNAAMANVLPSALRARGFGTSTLAIHLFGDALSPVLIGTASDRVGLQMPILVTGLLLVLAGVVLLFGRGALRRDLRVAATVDAS